MTDDYRSYESIKKSMREMGSIDSTNEIENLDAQSGYAHTVDTRDERQGLTLDEAFSILELRQNPILQTLLAQARVYVAKAESDSKDAKRPDRVARLDNSLGASEVVRLFDAAFGDAAEIVRNASAAERLNMNPAQSAIFQSVCDGRPATVQIAQPSVAALATNRAVSAEDVRRNTEAAIAYFGGRK